MADIIVVCENPKCNTIFKAENFISGTGNAQITLSNNKWGPCPKCGQMGRMKDGIHQFSNNILNLVSELPKSIPVLKEVEDVLKNAIAGEISQEVTLSAMSKLAPSVVNIYNTYNVQGSTDRITWVVLLPILLTLVQIAMDLYKDYIRKEDITPIKFEQRLLQENESLNAEIKRRDSVETDRQSRISYKNVSPNQQCPCGSGKKFKLCHGR
jgi:hypothetical protein